MLLRQQDEERDRDQKIQCREHDERHVPVHVRRHEPGRGAAGEASENRAGHVGARAPAGSVSRPFLMDIGDRPGENAWRHHALSQPPQHELP